MIRVLAIDDDEIFRGALAAQFRRWADPATYTLDILPQLPAPDASFFEMPTPDVLILDLSLPGTLDAPGTGGASTVRRARRLWPKTPVIVVTGRELNGETDEVKAAGACAAFNKLDIADANGFRSLLAAIKRALVDAGNVAAETTLTTTMNKIDMAPLVEDVAGQIRRLRRWALAVLSILGTAGGGGAYAWQAFTAGRAQSAPAPEHQLEAPAWFAPVASELKETRQKADAAVAAAVDVAGEVKELGKEQERTRRAVDRLVGFLEGAGIGRPSRRPAPDLDDNR